MAEKKHWAKCACGEEMVPGGSCKLDLGITADNKTIPRIPFGKETRFGAQEEEAEGTVCHDCNARLGGVHHLGCDWEECPVCGGQALGCECLPQVGHE